MWTLPIGLMRQPAGDVIYTLDTLTPAEVATITGMPTPTFMWDAGVASGADELVVGTDNLSDVGTVTKESDDAALGGKVSSTGAGNNGLAAASASVLDIGAETITGVWIGRPTAYPGVGFSGLLGKRDNTGALNGYELYFNASEYLAFVCDSASGTFTRTVAVALGTINAQVIGFSRSYANDVGSLWTREGAAEGTRFAETLTSTVTLGFGKTALRSTAGLNHGKFIVWVGTDGDGFGEAQRLAIAQALGYEA